MVYLFIGLIVSVFSYLLYLQNKKIKELTLLFGLLQLHIDSMFFSMRITNEDVSRIKRMLDKA